MVWQDFMFACSVYELTPEFEDNIRHEFTDNVKRIRHHASLALWCGNNEMEMFVDAGGCWVTKDTEVRDYLFMYERIIPRMLRNWILIPSTGRQVPPQAVLLISQTILIGEMYITGKYGMEINHFLSIENISSGMLQNSVFKHFRQ